MVSEILKTVISALLQREMGPLIFFQRLSVIQEFVSFLQQQQI